MGGQVVDVYANDSVVIAMDHLGQPFWEAGKQGRLSVPRCGSCGTFRLPPLPFCAKCQSPAMEWIDAAPVADLYSYTVCQTKGRGPDQPGFTYIPAVVELTDAGRVRLTGNLVGVSTDAVNIGMPLDLFWHPVSDGWMVPIFRPRSFADSSRQLLTSTQGTP